MIESAGVSPATKFTLDEAQHAADAWGANCGPGAIAAIMGMTLENLRPHLGDFEAKGYTNPTLMWEVLNRLGAEWRRIKPVVDGKWPEHGLVRIQWHGPWMAPAVPRRARYRHTHWVASSSHSDGTMWVFDINCMCVGGWVSMQEWEEQVAPWLIRECCPKGDGRWSFTDVVEIAPPAVPA